MALSICQDLTIDTELYHQLITTTIALLAACVPAAPTEAGAVESRSGVQLSQADAASRLTAAGITASASGSCTDRTKSTCVSYEGVYSGTVDGAITLKKACACSLVITGGTETGHASGTYSHSNGYKLDFRKDGKLNSYITSTFSRIADRSDGYPQWKSAAGNIYCVSVLPFSTFHPTLKLIGAN